MIIKDLSNADYQDDSAISRSDAVKISNSISSFLEKEPDDGKNGSFILGSWTHTRVQEPALYTPVIVPKMGRNTQKFEKLVSDEMKKDPSKKWSDFLTQEEADDIENMADAVFAHPKASLIYRNPDMVETSFFWTDDETGIKCKARTDIIWKDYIIDLKTTNDGVDYETICHTVKRYKYHVQAAWYLWGVRQDLPNIQGFLFCFVSKKTGEVALYELDQLALTKGFQFCRNALDKLDAWNLRQDENLRHVNNAEIVTLCIPYL